MRGNRQVADLLEIGIAVRVQAILEERLTLPVPNCPGGRLILWMTSSDTASPCGRRLKFGEGQWRTPRTQPVTESKCSLNEPPL